VEEFDKKRVEKTPHPLDGVKKDTPALIAWELQKKKMKERQAERERLAREAAGESTPPDWNMSSSSSSSSITGRKKAVDKTAGTLITWPFKLIIMANQPTPP